LHFKIEHTTTYTYSQPVRLEPHDVRLCPRSDAAQRLESLDLQVTPTPLQQSPIIELDGNTIVKLWFAPEPTSQLIVTVRSQVETLCPNPFNYLLEPWAQTLPLNYPASMLSQLTPYLCGPIWRGVDAAVATLAEEVSLAVNGNVSLFLTELNQRIHHHCKYVIRETGAPFPAGYTWSQGYGSCRDLAVLFMEACRSVGLAARFVSGYQCFADPAPDHVFQLHAWAEVYLPGAGWRGFDPTQEAGAVADRYIALVASADPRDTAPLPGSISQANGAETQMDSVLAITPQNPNPSTPPPHAPNSPRASG
jgi:transglutaminase-like putative cysteine protease